MSDNEFPEKLLKKLPAGWSSGADSMKEDELKKVIVKCEGNIYSINKDKENDEMLVAAKNTAKELSGPYRDASGVEQAKIRYALWVLENRGASIDNRDE